MLVLEESREPAMGAPGAGAGQAARPGPACRRCLFGAPDPESVRRFVEEEDRERYEEQKRRWNFDFEREEPLPGRYEWVRVGGRPEANGAAERRVDPPPAEGSRSPTRSRTSASRPAQPEAETSAAADLQGPSGDLSSPAAHPRVSPEVTPGDLTSPAASPATPNRPLHQQQITDCLRTRRQRRRPMSSAPPRGAPGPKRAARGAPAQAGESSSAAEPAESRVTES